MFFDVCVSSACKILLHKFEVSSSLVVFCIVRVRNGCLFGLGRWEPRVATEGWREGSVLLGFCVMFELHVVCV